MTNSELEGDVLEKGVLLHLLVEEGEVFKEMALGTKQMDQLASFHFIYLP